MTAETITREEITHWRDFIVDLDPPADADALLRIMDAARHSLDEPARLAAARAEGVREGIEMAAQEAGRIYGPGATVSQDYVDGYCDGRTAAALEIRALAPAPAEAPTTPTVAESDGWRPIATAPKDGTEIEVLAPGRDGLSPIQCRCAWHPDGGFCVDELRQPEWWRPVPNDGWVKWTCRPLVPLGTLVEIECEDGIRRGALPVEGWIWDAAGPNPIRAYRIVQPAEASAPVAPEEAFFDAAMAFGEAGRIGDLEDEVETQKERIASLEAEVAALRERGTLVVQALDGPGANAQLLVSAVDGLRALLQGQGGATREERVKEWVLDCFGPEGWTSAERAARVLEEAMELAQACGVPMATAQRALEHVFSRPAGEPLLEAGGVANTLFAWAAAHDATVTGLFDAEMARVEALPREKFRARWAEKKRLGMTAEGQGGADA